MMEQKLYNNEFLNAKRVSGDFSADQFIQSVFADPEKKLQLQQWLSGTFDGNMLDVLKDNYPDFAFISKARELPSWADPKLMKAGSTFFAKHAEIIMSLLGLLSLPYCYTAANGAMVLYLSELIKKQTTKRLYDTAVFVWEVMAPDAFGPKGNAYKEILKVRIMHAAVRYYTLQSGKWDDAWGLPINQEDMAGTNLSFSLIVVRGLRRMGFQVSHPDQMAFIHLWAVIGYLSGLDEELIPKDAKQAQQLDIVIKKRQFRTSAHGQELTQSLTDHILSINKSKATADDILGLMRYLLGSEIADMLSIKAPELPGYKLGILKTVNLLKSYKPEGDTNRNYQKAYSSFKKYSAEVKARV